MTVVVTEAMAERMVQEMAGEESSAMLHRITQSRKRCCKSSLNTHSKHLLAKARSIVAVR